MDFSESFDGPFYIRSDYLSSPDGGNEILFPSREEYLRALEDPTVIDPSQYRRSVDHADYLRAFQLDPPPQSRSKISENFFPATVRFRGRRLWFWSEEYYVRAHMSSIFIADEQDASHPRHNEYVQSMTEYYSSIEYPILCKQARIRSGLSPVEDQFSFFLRASQIAANQLVRYFPPNAVIPEEIFRVIFDAMNSVQAPMNVSYTAQEIKPLEYDDITRLHLTLFGRKVLLYSLRPPSTGSEVVNFVSIPRANIECVMPGNFNDERASNVYALTTLREITEMVAPYPDGSYRPIGAATDTPRSMIAQPELISSQIILNASSGAATDAATIPLHSPDPARHVVDITRANTPDSVPSLVSTISSKSSQSKSSHSSKSKSKSKSRSKSKLDPFDRNHPQWRENVMNIVTDRILPHLFDTDINLKMPDFEKELDAKIFNSNWRFTRDQIDSIVSRLVRDMLAVQRPPHSPPVYSSHPVISEPMGHFWGTSDQGSVASARASVNSTSIRSTESARVTTGPFGQHFRRPTTSREPVVTSYRPLSPIISNAATAKNLLRNDLSTKVTVASPPSPVVQPAPLVDRAELAIAERLAEKDSLYRPKMTETTPEQCRKVLRDYPLYQAQNNGKGKPLWLLLQNMLGPIFCDGIPTDLSDPVMINALQSLIPKVNSEYVYDYFKLNVSMSGKKDAAITAADVYKYRDAFAKFVHHFADYWITLGDKAFEDQRDYFLKGIRPTELRERLIRGKHAITSMQRLMQVLLDHLQVYPFSTRQKTPPKTQANNSAKASPAAQSTATQPVKTPPTTKPFNDPKSVKAVKSGGKAVPPHTFPRVDSDDEVITFSDILDSGSAVHTVPTPDSLTKSTITSEIGSLTLEAANESAIPIVCKGHKFLHNSLHMHETYVTPSIPQGVVSPQNLIIDNDIAILFHKDKAFSFPKTDVISAFLENLINHHSVSTLAALDPIDNLYKICNTSSAHTNPKVKSFSSVPTVGTISRYATANFKTVAEEVLFFHQVLGHVDAEQMIQFIKSPSVKDFGSKLTPDQIRKHFPTSCPDCPIGNLQLRHPPAVPVSVQRARSVLF